ncbi:hypothetical protein A71_183 [Escherichia phage A7_1]|nr:hypothetical protein A71_183 [Escherichia phage A7_1]
MIKRMILTFAVVMAFWLIGVRYVKNVYFNHVTDELFIQISVTSIVMYMAMILTLVAAEMLYEKRKNKATK